MHHACCCPHRFCLTHPSAGVQGEAAALELAAAEMAQAAATLVSIERDIVEMVQNKVRAKCSGCAWMLVAACCLGEAQERVACKPAAAKMPSPVLGACLPCWLAPAGTLPCEGVQQLAGLSVCRGTWACAVQDLPASSAAMPKLAAVSGTQQSPTRPRHKEHHPACKPMQVCPGCQAMNSSCLHALFTESAIPQISAVVPHLAAASGYSWILSIHCAHKTSNWPAV